MIVGMSLFIIQTRDTFMAIKHYHINKNALLPKACSPEWIVTVK